MSRKPKKKKDPPPDWTARPATKAPKKLYEDDGSGDMFRHLVYLRKKYNHEVK